MVEDPQQPLLNQVSALIKEMNNRNGGKDFMDQGDREEHANIMKGIYAVKTSKDVKSIQRTLDAWKRDLKQRFPPR
ncbi:hypothetical protein HMI51_10245 [Corallococcus coralloides]|nr:hypothetical protein [Corallococcus coralloides]